MEHLSVNVIPSYIIIDIMKRKITTIVLLLLCISSITQAQIEQDIIRPSVNADQFGIGAKAEAALCKGQLSVNIPLFELKGRGYNLPISLTFYSGDVTFSTEASPIGLGWALMAGGVITKTIKGTDDTVDNGFRREHHYHDDFLHNNLYETNRNALYSILEEIRMDPMPDEYSYSLPGHSGTIDVTIEGETISRQLYPDESYRIEDCEHGLCITADDGTKFYFEDMEEHQSEPNAEYQSASWFLTRIVTIKGGVFTFNYAKEEYFDISSRLGQRYYKKYRTNRITSIVSDYGSVVFQSVERSDRDEIGDQSITPGYESRRINRIELKDEIGNLVKGYELDNSGCFKYFYAPQDFSWTDIRHKLSSVTQYDSLGNRLPPYEFEYDYKFMKSRLTEEYVNSPNGEYEPLDSWTSPVGTHAFANLDHLGHPTSLIMDPETGQPDISGPMHFSPTIHDYFCLTGINYPTGARDKFTYEPHAYGKVNDTRSPQNCRYIQGRRLASKIRYGTEATQQIDYIYNLHDSAYNVRGNSSGVLTNPSFHRATYYTPGSAYPNSSYIASKVTSGRAFNSFMGPPVFYTEVEEVEKDMDSDVIGRNIHYYEPNIVNPPTNYIYVHSNSNSIPLSFVEIQNRILGTLPCYSGYTHLFTDVNMTYLAYPVGEFCVDSYFGEHPLKEVFIGKDGRVRSVKQYNFRESDTFTKFGYKIDKQEVQHPQISPNVMSTIFRFSKTDYITRRWRPSETNTTIYFYNGEECDSIRECSSVGYNKGRIASSGSYRENDNENEHKVVLYYFPDDIRNMVTNSSSAEINAVNGLIENNIIADPIKTIIRRNGHIIGGECKDYQMESGMPLLKSLYKIKNTTNNYMVAPVINGNNIDYRSDLYKEGEILTYDENRNPEHIKINDMQSRIYVWGYDGRFPIAVIDNLDYESFNTDTALKSMLHGLEQYRKIETEQDCMNLRNVNTAIRQMLPEGAHITTYTYDPYFGMTSETSDSNIGTIYTYDSFGRLSAKYDTFFKKTEEYNYNYHRQ